jgi:hypothetical protein
VTEKRDVLEFIAERSAEGRSTTSEKIAEQFDLHPLSACDHLKRLWRERLIRATPSRPARYHFRLLPSESIEELHFRLARRGRERLDWYEEQDEEEE